MSDYDIILTLSPIGLCLYIYWPNGAVTYLGGGTYPGRMGFFLVPPTTITKKKTTSKHADTRFTTTPGIRNWNWGERLYTEVPRHTDTCIVSYTLSCVTHKHSSPTGADPGGWSGGGRISRDQSRMYSVAWPGCVFKITIVIIFLFISNYDSGTFDNAQNPRSITKDPLSPDWSVFYQTHLNNSHRMFIENISSSYGLKKKSSTKKLSWMVELYTQQDNFIHSFIHSRIYLLFIYSFIHPCVWLFQ